MLIPAANEGRPNLRVNRLGASVFTIEQFLAPAECAHFIAASEALGYDEASIHTEEGDRLYKDARNNHRVIVDNRTLAGTLYERASPVLPASIDGWRLCGLNERLRYYRYESQQKFTWHQDGTVRLGPNEESFLTFMVYLNDNFTGGSTDFGWESVVPRQGMALVFPHRLRHQGSAVVGGVKYVLRTDVMYRNEADPPPRATLNPPPPPPRPTP